MDPNPQIRRARGRARGGNPPPPNQIGQPRGPPPNQSGQPHGARPAKVPPPPRPQAKNIPDQSGPQSVRNIFLNSK